MTESWVNDKLERGQTETAIIIFGAPANIQIELHPNTGLKDYWCVNLLSHNEANEDDDDNGLQFL
jgi:hypothetical protein